MEPEIFVYRARFFSLPESGLSGEVNIEHPLAPSLQMVAFYRASLELKSEIVRGQECITHVHGPSYIEYGQKAAALKDAEDLYDSEAVDQAILEFLDQARQDGKGTQVLSDLNVIRKKPTALQLRSGQGPRWEQYTGRLSLEVQMIGSKFREE